MIQPDFNYFVLIIPACLLMLGIAFAMGGLMLRNQDFLRWIAVGYILPCVGLTVQSLMTNQQLADWSVITACLYLFGIWAVAQGMAQRTGGSANPRLALLISGITLLLLFYYSQVDENLWMRIIVLNTGIGFIQMLVAKHFFRPISGDLLDRILTISYICIIIYTLVRPAVIAISFSPDDLVELTTSNYWLMMLSASLLLSLWLALLIVAVTVRDMVMEINDERYRDSLTHLLNRRGFFEAAKQFMSGGSTAHYFLLTCDIDHFKQVNDNWGHPAGDKVLQIVSKTISKNVRKGDLVSRFGGEEFVVFLRSMDINDAHKIAERIRQEIAATHYSVIPAQVTASFGLVSISPGQDLQLALNHADERLYSAKQNGRNQVCWR